MKRSFIICTIGLIILSLLLFSCNKEILDLSKGKADLFNINSSRQNNITNLDLSENDLNEIPIFVFGLQNLETLNLSKNNIKSIPANLSDLKSLRILNLSSNNIESISESVRGLSNLRLLNLIDNPIPIEHYESGKCLVNDSCLILISNDFIEYPPYCK